MMITNAFEGREACVKLELELNRLKYNPDLRKMLRNISNMVTEVSKKEVLCRQSHSLRPLEEPLAKLNSAVDHLQKLILVAQLMD